MTLFIGILIGFSAAVLGMALTLAFMITKPRKDEE